MPAAAPPAPPPAAPSTPAALPAPSTPAPAPAPATPPAKPAATKTPPVSKPATDLKNAYDQLDRLAAGGETPPPEKPANEGDEPAELPDPAAVAGEAAPDGAPAAPVKAKTLRETLDHTKSELAKAQARVKELESAAPKPDPEKAKLTENLTTAQKRLQELEDELRFANFERHPDYKDKYETPFLDAFDAGRKKVSSFKLVDEAGAERQGTPEDFDRLMRITDDNDAADRAVEWFGNKAAMVLVHREQVQQLHSARLKAIADYRKEGGVREQQRAEAQTKQRADRAALWETEVKSALENPKYQPWFKAPDGDTVGSEILEKGAQFADEAFGKPPRDESGKFIQRTPEDVVKMHAAVRNFAAAFPYAIHRNQLLQKELREAKKELAEFKASVPGNGNGRGQRNAPMDTWGGIDADLARRADR